MLIGKQHSSLGSISVFLIGIDVANYEACLWYEKVCVTGYKGYKVTVCKVN